MFQNLGHFFSWIIDQGGKAPFILPAQGIAEYIVYLAPHGSGAVFKNMGKSLPLPVDIRKKMFRCFRQVQYGFQIDYFCGCRGHSGIKLCQPF